jgi:predicted ester cyclase
MHTGEFMGAAPTGRQVIVTGMNLFRIAGGKIVEIWLNADDLSELQQLGVR